MALFTETLEQHFREILSEFGDFHVKLCGDTNLNLLKQSYNTRALFLNIIYCKCSAPQLFRPTRVAKMSATLIGHILVNGSHLVKKNRV